jgi:hypothetical protein
MIRLGIHISDQDLLQTIEGELSRRKSAAVRAHCENCWSCRERMEAIQSTIIDFTRAHRQTLDAHLPPVEGPRALLRARLSERAQVVENPVRPWFPRLTFAFIFAGVCSLLLAIAILGGAFLWRAKMEPGRASRPEKGTIPDRYLTPGMTRPVSISEVCAMPHEEVIREVPNSLRQQVFAEYGVQMANADDYEVDYLIAPGLGGTDDIHNLWPEPLKSHEWNAHVKDALEERLHQLVCAHQIDLATAQREIAADWIAAYIKYFHTDKPQFRRSITG